MLKQIIRAALALTAAIFMSASAFAAEAYTRAKFEAAQSAGKPILIDINAPWCPVCKAQGQVLRKLTASSKYKGLTVLKVDFDSQKDVVRSFGARQQSTLIAFKGRTETGRLSYEADPSAVENVVRSAF